MILSPAYGRDYRSAKAATEDFLKGKDFIVEDIVSPWCGKPCSITDLNIDDTFIELRYNQKRNLVCLRKNPKGEWRVVK